MGRPLLSIVSQAPVGRKPTRGSNVMPTREAILSITKAQAGEYELSDRECKQLRAQIYSINKENVVGMRFRTLREGGLLLVWRIR